MYCHSGVALTPGGGPIEVVFVHITNHPRGPTPNQTNGVHTCKLARSTPDRDFSSTQQHLPLGTAALTSPLPLPATPPLVAGGVRMRVPHAPLVLPMHSAMHSEHTVTHHTLTTPSLPPHPFSGGGGI